MNLSESMSGAWNWFLKRPTDDAVEFRRWGSCAITVRFEEFWLEGEIEQMGFYR